MTLKMISNWPVVASALCFWALAGCSIPLGEGGPSFTLQAIEPESMLRGEALTIKISGTGFDGAREISFRAGKGGPAFLPPRIFLGNVEMPTTHEWNSTQLQVKVPSDFPMGVHRVRVQNSRGDFASGNLLFTVLDPDSLTDGGSGILDGAAQISDGGTSVDGGAETMDGGSGSDAGVMTDSGGPMDAGLVPDGGSVFDGGVGLDGGVLMDSGNGLDSGSFLDAGAVLDSGPMVDSGASMDSGTDGGSGVDAGITLFFDDFESGGLSSWTLSGPGDPWLLETVEVIAGLSSARSIPRTTTDPGAVIQVAVSTFGHQGIVVEYTRLLAGLDAADDFQMLFWDGAMWTIAEQTNSTTDPMPLRRRLTLPSSADNQPAFELRFQCKAGAVSESCTIDDVRIAATQ